VRILAGPDAPVAFTIFRAERDERLLCHLYQHIRFRFSCSRALSVRGAGIILRADNQTGNADERKRQGPKLPFRKYCVRPISCMLLAMCETTRSSIPPSFFFFEYMYAVTTMAQITRLLTRSWRHRAQLMSSRRIRAVNMDSS
jgi:hypothetical protein